LNAEKYASLAWLDGKPYPADALTEAWKKITFKRFSRPGRRIGHRHHLQRCAA